METPSWIQVGVPTLDRPFGLQLWPIFERAFTAVKGYAPQDFRFVEGKTPMSTLSMTITVLISYYIVIFGGREVMRSRSAVQLNPIFKIHNFYLTAISGILLVLFIEQLLPTLARHGVFYTICSHGGGWTKELVILYYVSLISPAMRRKQLLIQLISSSTTSPSTSSFSIPSSSSLRRSRLLSFTHTTTVPPPRFATPSSSATRRFLGFRSR